ncbi:hypothetical protein OVY01_14660 [Robbsia sp. Bb-Pol-6]|uniref:Metallo-beta-lactamase domain-containing protein n=1 Tax=Robbsia betulipollinis TaxID=2981849 RepID=A0ABT3ZPH0_9BURK|nr:hypothetical protein [Robbsia betulipollinis]MCY0388444.1 hypothetical protein [Robbsia betulipollinis]
MKLFAEYYFYPVGQGMFSSGALGTRFFGEFHWVFDCGSVKKNQSLLENEIRRLELLLSRTALRSKPKLDVTFISHFDVDHISGLVKLLNSFDVDTLVIPYVPLWQRIVATITSPQADNQRFQHFMMNPVSFIGSLDGAKVRRIVLVPPSAGSLPDDPDDIVRDPPSPLGGLPPLEPDRIIAPADEQIALTADRPTNISISCLAPGGRLLLGKVWEFVLYNEPNLNIKATAHFKLAARRVSTALLQTNDPDQRDRILKRLKRMYDRIFGSTSTKKNEISLFVYGGPVGRYLAQYRGAKDDISRARTGYNHFKFWHCPICVNHLPVKVDDTANILYTGDGYLSSKQRVRKLREYFGARRLENLAVFQVMHHGSLRNWRKGIAAEFQPETSIFCADPSYSYGHPNRTVWDDFEPYGAKLVNRVGVLRFYRLKLL